jgi:hypothetical protein
MKNFLPALFLLLSVYQLARAAEVQVVTVALVSPSWNTLTQCGCAGRRLF